MLKLEAITKDAFRVTCCAACDSENKLAAVL